MVIMLARTDTYISTVDKSRTILLPDTVPVGARVAVVLLPSVETPPDADAERTARFTAVMKAIAAAQVAGFTPPEISNAEH
jgi:hypothetical protein